MIISIIRTLILYAVIIIAVRLMGKRQISELQTSELVVTLLISDIAAIPMQNTSQPLLSGFVPMLILVMCEIILSVLMIKHSKFRRFVCGKPQIVINNGTIDQQQMKRLRMSNEDLMEQLRQADVFSLNDVAYAIVETNGKMSILKKGESSPPTAKMLGIKSETEDFDVVVINQGIISDFALRLCNISNQWVKNTLTENKINQNDVYMMTANKSKEYNIITKE